MAQGRTQLRRGPVSLALSTSKRHCTAAPIAIQGFEDAELSYYKQTSFGRRKRLYTIVGRRTQS